MGFVLWRGTTVSILQLIFFVLFIIFGIIIIVLIIKNNKKFVWFISCVCGSILSLMFFFGGYFLPEISLNGRVTIGGNGHYNGLLKHGIFNDIKSADGSGGDSEYIWRNGDKYIGEWVDGKCTGNGEMTIYEYKYKGKRYAQYSIDEGTFINNEFVKGKRIIWGGYILRDKYGDYLTHDCIWEGTFDNKGLITGTLIYYEEDNSKWLKVPYVNRLFKKDLIVEVSAPDEFISESQ